MIKNLTDKVDELEKKKDYTDGAIAGLISTIAMMGTEIDHLTARIDKLHIVDCKHEKKKLGRPKLSITTKSDT